jgi:hypothetical protein
MTEFWVLGALLAGFLLGRWCERDDHRRIVRTFGTFKDRRYCAAAYRRHV